MARQTIDVRAFTDEESFSRGNREEADETYDEGEEGDVPDSDGSFGWLE